MNKRIFNKTKTTELNNYDLSLGKLIDDKLFIKHHKAVNEIAEKSHYETIAEYPNGGKDVELVIDVMGQKAHEAWDEYEDIFVYVPYTAAELADFEIAKLKAELQKTDYKAIKFAEGQISAVDYEPIKQSRQALRDRINALENNAKGMGV